MWDGRRDRPTIAEIDLTCIARNIQGIRKIVGSDCEILAVVKADAYGHGAIPAARTALNNGANWLGVALVEEGIALRRSGIIAPILVLAQLFPTQAQAALRYNLSCAVATYEFAEALSNAAVKEGKKAKCHVKIDTGMGRIGLYPNQAVSFVKRIAMLPNIEIEGVFTHLATAEAEDRSFLYRQLSLFNDATEALKSNGIQAQYYHAANSVAAVTVPEARFDIVRPGIFIYGVTPLSGEEARGIRSELDITPALSLKTRVGFVKRCPKGASIGYGATYTTDRDCTIVTLPIGYADGFPRALSNRGQVLIRGNRLPVVGRVCMDEFMVCAGDLEVDMEDEVIIIGRQGKEEITAEEVAEKAHTISHEVLCGISRRVPRVYQNRP
ncbi:MAG: alanine racemase [Firmicutes bacterium]|mgnify:FL=1|nr:alanine racemase [Bacillota bacterium]